ncbi:MULTISPECIES: NAD/NADP octopine/nopaline dehydrogenase family protein [Agrobacterium]|uniref:2-dehydropantoate 2-reductase n=2 Tax=Agrobacterium tumefaciens complex TaxID=1183400 RepID=A0AAE6BK68_AGRTU|nr:MULTISPECIES: NAD/NADP octopine/nopaline dehydrogenase family protein [Agrobacterium]ASK40590.1 NAD/NADP octopine/nopaline dehydrogenase [Agrobacterium genomosp. 6]ASK41353.1 NAD/NADP octopine/nopaline dehydrogenase [Agrobacterium genomosp. 6]QCL77592.1 NAD/NADP octopine/nopaline dehydrogenase [Agrobacterium tumefaciens]QCL83082.1 NAD/NADP octopine/nopaline dehydrogenase [Agrobacterium tumefaciens]CUX71264.1 LecE [Agrobacterium sp. NCPPB 925]
MRVGIAGAGAIAMGYVAFLDKQGHSASVWSPTGAGTVDLAKGAALTITGMIEGEFSPAICRSAEELASNDVIVLALPAYGHRSVLQTLIPFIRKNHTVIISSHLSLAALFLSKRLSERGIEIPIVAWSTTVLTSKQRGPNTFNIGTIRDKVDMATVPTRFADAGLAICANVFGDRFNLKDDILTIALSNLNPQNHLAVALCNLTRIERGESWGQNTNLTSAVGNLIEALDRERVAIASAFGKDVRTVFDHYRLTHKVKGDRVWELAVAVIARGNDPMGPKSLDTRYILEDVPFGLMPTLLLAELAGITAPLHRSGVNIISACYDRDFGRGNDILEELGPLMRENLLERVVTGFPLNAHELRSVAQVS